jgi:hypothetical protein
MGVLLTVGHIRCQACSPVDAGNRGDLQRATRSQRPRTRVRREAVKRARSVTAAQVTDLRGSQKTVRRAQLFHATSAGARTRCALQVAAVVLMRAHRAELQATAPVYFETVSFNASNRICIAGPTLSTGRNSASPCIDITPTAGTITGVKP